MILTCNFLINKCVFFKVKLVQSLIGAQNKLMFYFPLNISLIK
jgi:hypothetical protein